MANRHWLISIFHGNIQLKLIQRMRFKAEVTTDLFVAQRLNAHHVINRSRVHILSSFFLSCIVSPKCVLKTGSRKSATHLFYPKKMLRCLAWGEQS